MGDLERLYTAESGINMVYLTCMSDLVGLTNKCQPLHASTRKRSRGELGVSETFTKLESNPFTYVQASATLLQGC